MLVIQEISPLRQKLSRWRSEGERIALVPTMGNLHDGHLSLIRRAQKDASKVVGTIYVNPLQFDRPDDLTNYPRTMQLDLEMLEAQGVDLVFTPSNKVIYPDGIEMSSKVDVPKISTILCGMHRPGHFVGVATVVCKLFNLVLPDIAVFGEKDFQQLLLIKRMAKDLNFSVDIIGAKTQREASGLAMSSRNSYLSESDRAIAAVIYKALCVTAEKLVDGQRYYPGLEKEGRTLIESANLIPDYFAILNKSDLQAPSPEAAADQLVILAAALLGSARLIDNLQVSQYSK